MSTKCFISFKTEDECYKTKIQNDLNIDMIDKSVNEAYDLSDEAVIEQIRKDHIGDSTVTIHLIGAYGGESRGSHEQRFIKRELQLSLYNGPAASPTGNRNGLLGVVLPTMHDRVFGGSTRCSRCEGNRTVVNINGNTTVAEFHRNFYVRDPSLAKCCWSDDERYAIVVSWDDFCSDPESWIDMAEEKRRSAIAEKVVVFPK